MPEQISGGMGFGSIRLNGQIVHFQGLHDVYSVNPIGASDTITVGDQAAAHNAGALYVEAVTILDRFNEASIQAEAIEVLSSEGVTYAIIDEVGIHDTLTSGAVQAESMRVIDSEGATYETTETVAFADTAAKS